MAGRHLHSTVVDVGEAEARLRDSYPTLRIHRRRGDQPFILEERFDGDVDFNVVEMVFSMGSTASVEDSGGLLIIRTLDHPIQVSDGRRFQTTDRPVLVVPGAPFSGTWEQSDVQGILVPDDAVREHTERRIRADDVPIGSPVIRAPSQILANQWNRFADYLVKDFFRDEAAFENDLIRVTTQELCVRMLLPVFFSPSLHRSPDGRGAMPKSVQRAVVFIDEHAQEPISVVNIADAARLSLRGLQAAFRRHLDATPYQYLRVVRLNGARDELRHPGDDTAVASVARTWGFAHLSRFAGDYRELFGETPRVTLQRGRAE